jgi:hypothetical protein
MFCDTPKGIALAMQDIEEHKEISRIHRKHWFQTLIGVPDQESYARYDRDQFGHKRTTK